MTVAPVPTLQPGDLLWTRSEGLIGALIRAGERIRLYGLMRAIGRGVSTIWHRHIPENPNDMAWGNHIATYVGGGMVVEALAHGLTLSPASKYLAGTFRVLPLTAYRPDCTDADRDELVRFAREELARRDGYGWLCIGSIIVQLLTPVKLDISWDGTMICSAFGARCLEHVGVILPTLSPYTTMPSDLAVMALNPHTTEGEAA